ncbi:chloride channel protein [Pauljensenia sp. UMB3104]|uniref:chloride channel protein n=1 Tax=Pauljensenia sp. UMB3104 TaxID=3046331 RepID=UPI00254DFCC8|nr:chloride channel protein [Pauljensenia sp. UMB3104]MDK7160125.1 chloride channel protein [Pauljensenia sp. UMB3104]
MSVSTRRLAVATLLTGLVAGLVGLTCKHILHWIQALAWDMDAGTLLEAASTASPTRRILILTIGGLIGALSWFLLFRRDKAITSVSAAVDGTPMPPLRASWHALTQIVIVSLGASVGREVAPREMAAAFSAAVADRLGLTPKDRRIIVACAAGAGLAAVYSIPLSGAIYTLEILLVSLSARAVAPALITSGIAVLVSTGFTRPAFFYTVPTLTPSLSLTVFGALMGPVLGAAGWVFKEAVARTGAIRPRDWRILITLPLAFVVVGLVSTRIPSVLGNGQASAQTQFDATWAAGAGLAFALLVLLAKTATTFLTIGAGGWGGVLTPAVALGAGLGAVIGLPWATAWPGSEIAAFAFIGAAAFLGASMKAPFTGLILVIEFTGQGATILVPAVLAVGGATAAASWLSRRASLGRQP